DPFRPDKGASENTLGTLPQRFAGAPSVPRPPPEPVHPTRYPARGRHQIALEPRRVGVGAPPWTARRAAVIGSDHEVDPDLVESLERRPPRRRRAERNLQVGRWAGDEKLHRRWGGDVLKRCSIIRAAGPRSGAFPT